VRLPGSGKTNHILFIVKAECGREQNSIHISLFVDYYLSMSGYFLFKSEPDVYSFDDLLGDKETIWDGVTNPTAVKHLREMKPGTRWIFYHTGEERRAVGTGTVVSVDATDPKVPIVRVKAGKRLRQPKTLAAIKAEPLFAASPLVLIGRLSVVPLTEEQWKWFMEEKQ
jgi:predicted RNA-binding protein with PUA-like domain